MNVYDFDKTVYDGDSTVDFYRFCICKYPGLISCIPAQVWGGLQYAAGRTSTKKFKERFFCFLPRLSSLDTLTGEFWDTRQNKLKAWYLAQKQSDDVIISASPSFLLNPICERLGIEPPIATEVDLAAGKIKGENCKGEEKVRRFLEIYGAEEIEAFYSDAQTDVFLARIAKRAFLVKKNVIQEWRL